MAGQPLTTEKAILQTLENIRAALAWHGLETPKAVLTTQADRVTSLMPETFAESIPAEAFRLWPFSGNHGTTALRSWRECCGMYALHLVEHRHHVWEFDIDYVNPSPQEGLAFTIGHFFEVTWNRLARRKTDPFKVRRGLIKRGIQVPLVLVMLWAMPVQAQDTAFRASMVAAVAAHGADLGSTMHCLGSGRCREMNPLLARFEQPAVFGAVKMSVVGLQLWALAKLHERHPRWAIGLNLLSAGAFSAIAYHNTQVAR